jgi:hypothetical protein
MNYPSFKHYVRFYKYGVMKMVKVENPITDPYAYIYEDNIRWGITCVDTRAIGTYYPYGYSDWAQVDPPPEYITKLQHFQWYFKKWKKFNDNIREEANPR